MSYINPPYYITAYSLAQKRGFTGTLDEWLESLTAFYIAKQAGYQGTAEQWVQKLNDPVPKIKIGTVTTLEGGSMATVEIGGTPEEPILSFGIPRGMGMVDALALVGGTMLGTINMGGFRIYGLPVPTADDDAVPKGYLDETLQVLRQAVSEAISAAASAQAVASGALGAANTAQGVAANALAKTGEAVLSSEKGKNGGVATLNENGKVPPKQTRSTITVISGTSHKIVPDNEGRMLRVYNEGADCVITLPGDSDDDLEVGAEIEILCYTKGSVTIKAPADRYLLYAGCAQNTMGGSLKIGHTYGCVALKKVAAVSWIASGDIE